MAGYQKLIIALLSAACIQVHAADKLSLFESKTGVGCSQFKTKAIKFELARFKDHNVKKDLGSVASLLDNKVNPDDYMVFLGKTLTNLYAISHVNVQQNSGSCSSSHIHNYHSPADCNVVRKRLELPFRDNILSYRNAFVFLIEDDEGVITELSLVPGEGATCSVTLRNAFEGRPGHDYFQSKPVK